jgi:hypothetical protein
MVKSVLYVSLELLLLLEDFLSPLNSQAEQPLKVWHQLVPGQILFTLGLHGLNQRLVLYNYNFNKLKKATLKRGFFFVTYLPSYALI